MFCVCVVLLSAENERGEKKRCDLEVICMEEWEIMHGSPMGNSEVATKVNFSSYPLEFGPWAENGGEKKRFLGFLLLSPTLVLIRVFIGLIK